MLQGFVRPLVVGESIVGRRGQALQPLHNASAKDAKVAELKGVAPAKEAERAVEDKAQEHASGSLLHTRLYTCNHAALHCSGGCFRVRERAVQQSQEIARNGMKNYFSL